jgi:hemolysin activation/secretion protein
MKIEKGIVHVSLALGMLLPGFSAMAANAAVPLPALEAIRSTVEPARTGESISLSPLEESLIPPNFAVQSSAMQKLSPEVSKLKFVLQGIKITDNRVFSCEELLRPFQEYMGTTITLGKLEEIAHHITLFYQKAGYVLTQVIIPPQKINNGVVTLQVISGHIDKVEISGDVKPELKELLECYGKEIQAMIPLQAKVLERYLLLANDIPGLRVQSVLTPSKHKTGAADLVLVVNQQLDSGFLAANNFGTRYQGPQQFIVNVEEYSKFCPADVTQYQYVTTGNKQLNSGQVRHSELITPDGLRASAFGQVLKSRPASTLAPLNIIGNYNIVGADAFYPIIRSRRQNFSVRGGLMILESKANVLNLPFYNDRIRPLSLSFLFNQWDNLRALNGAELAFTQGIKMLNASGSTNISRPGAKSAFTRINLTMSRLQPLPCGFSCFTLVTGQTAFQPLLSAMQFGFGGPYLGRGYDPSEIVGDRGLAGTFELRYNPEISSKSFLKIISYLQFYAFYDVGKIWNINKLSFIREASAASDGLGVRFNFLRYLDANFFVAKPLTRIVLANQNRHLRYFFSITANIAP